MKRIGVILMAVVMPVVAGAQGLRPVPKVPQEPQEPQEPQQQEPAKTWGAWVSTEVSHTFDSGVYASYYFEYDNLELQRMECIYWRLAAGYNVLPWLSVGANYVPVMLPGGKWLHYAEADVMGTLRSGNFKASIRERWHHGMTTHSNELRSRLKVGYSIPSTNVGIYLAPEVFTWGNEWTKTRHYVGATYNFTPSIQLDAYYLYYTFKDRPAENYVGVGVNFSL